MKLFLTSVSPRKGAKCVPGIMFFAEWTKPMGFVTNALAQFVPEPGGAQFRLCNENITSYSQLFEQTEALGGVLVHIKTYKNREYPCLAVSGHVMERTGLVNGDNIIVRFDYGLAHLRKIPPGQVRIINAGNERLSGQWLYECGFAPEEVLTVAAEPGRITCQLEPNGVKRTAELVKYARANALHLIQVRQKVAPRVVVPIIEIQPSRFAKAGFVPEDILLATYEHGRIQLEKLDLTVFGFPPV